MTRYYILYGFLLFNVVIISSCGKKGCTDPDSINYDHNAKRSDESCRYQGKVIFWYNKTTEDSLKALGYKSEMLYFVIDGTQLTGNSWAGRNFTFTASPAAPDCPQDEPPLNYTFNPYKEIDLRSSTSKNIHYQVMELDGTVVFEGNKTIQANTCNSIQLEF